MLKYCSCGGGSLTVLSPFSTRALGGGELEACRVLRGDWSLRKASGGARRVWEVFDTSVMEVKASR